MVRFAPKFNLRTPSCCNVDVVNGGAALRERLRFSTFVTTASALPMASTTACASFSVVISIFSPLI